MKPKKLILAMATLLAAGVGAFASRAAQDGKYINVRYSDQANFTCTPVDVCNTILPVVCQVNIDGFTATVYGKRESTTLCAQPFQGNPGIVPIVNKLLTVVQVQ